MSTVRRSHGSQSGFSLAEVFVATAIFAVIFIAALLVYDRSNKVFKAGVEAADLQQNTRVAFDKVLADTRLAGFDFDRDGVPTSAGQSQQPDEQIEYAGRSAITIRGNFNYNAAENGRVTALEIPNSQFPIVTTGNDEIVTYALVPDSPSAVTENLVFYADVTNGTDAKRQSYPGGSVEDTITITGVDLCAAGCNQPPYTLYRFTVKDDGGVERTPLANNIRDLRFTYFNDITGTTALAITDPGGGAYDPATPASLNAAARVKRAEIKAIRLQLVGLNQSSDTGWTQVGETVASVKNRRQYTLESMVVPRNLGKRGMREQQTTAPGVPILKTVCFNYCGLVRLTWQAPAADLNNGEVETYHVLWDTDTSPLKQMDEPPQEAQSAGLATTTVIAGLDPNTEYRFSVAATNSYGTTYAEEQVVGKPLNATTPKAPKLDSVTAATPLPNEIKLAWTLPTQNIDTAKMASCVSPPPSPGTSAQEAPPEKGEMQGIEVWRSSASATFNPTVASSTTVKVATVSASAAGYSDTTAANCKNYYYRIRIVEYCGTDPTKNVGTVVGVSDFYPAVGTDALLGRAESFVEPGKPGPLVVNLASSSCTGSGAAAECSVTMTWPEVKSDLGGSTIAVDAYDLRIINSSGTTTRALSVSNGDVSVSSGVVTHVAKVPKSNPITLVNYVNEFSARAVQCAVPGQYSNSDTYPKCNFANGTTLTISMSGLNAGTGTAADPFEILGAETITFSVPTPNKIVRAEVSIYNAASGALVQTLTPVTGATNSIGVGWPDSGDNTNYRVDYVLTDGVTPTGCTYSGSFYVRETLVTCPFVTLASPTSTSLADPGTIKFGLKNQTDFDITFVRAEITWDELVAHSTRQVTADFVKLPSGSGSGTVNATLTSGPGTGSTTTTGTFTATSASAAKVFANDMTGNYLMQVIFTTTGNKSLEGQPISNIIIFYRLPGDSVSETRSCDIF
jgi:Fibronectin type III domain